MVKKRLVFLLMCLFSMAILNAQELAKHDISADVAAQGLFGYNNTYKWFAGTDLKGVMHVDNTDFSLNFEVLTENVYSVGYGVSPSFRVFDDGYVFFDGTLHSRILGKYKVYEFVYAGSVGFKMNHFTLQAGIFSRNIDVFGKDRHSFDSRVTEPFNFLYKLKISIMGLDNPWDIYMIGTNFNDFEYERMWSPLFTLGGRWDFKDRWSAVAEGTLKPVGMFHGTVRFYEAVLRVGVSFRLETVGMAKSPKNKEI